jgi:predicted phosphodiesterase
MIYLLGDTHGNFTKLKRYSNYLSPDDIVIHVGDFGVYHKVLFDWERYLFPEGFPCKLMFIDGNHEDFSLLYNYPIDKKTGLRPIFKNLYHIPRGTVMELEGKLFGFLGGGESIDKAFRTEGLSWWSEERISEEDVELLISNVGNRQLDYLITHTCTHDFRERYFGTLDLKKWKLNEGWEDISMYMMDRVVSTLKPKMHIFGHMHRSIREKKLICLDIDELIELPDCCER